MPKRDNMLHMIEEGMKVFNNSGDEVGTVEWVHFGEVDGAVSPSAGPVSSDLVEIVGDAFSSDKLPKELRERLLMSGFVKMDSKRLFGADRYVMADQIDRVEKSGVRLAVADSDGLLKS